MKPGLFFNKILFQQNHGCRIQAGSDPQWTPRVPGVEDRGCEQLAALDDYWNLINRTIADFACVACVRSKPW